MSTKKNDKFPIFIAVIIVFVVAMVGGYLCQLIWHTNEDTTDNSITRVGSEEDEKEGDADASLKYTGYATLLSDEQLVTLNFINPSKSKKSLSLEIVADIDGESVTLARTDKIRPGYKISSVKSILDDEIPKGNYKGKFVVCFYNEQDKEEIVNSEIKIDIYVK